MDRYVILEDFNDTINLVIDEEGNTMIFTDVEEAIVEASDCHSPTIVNLDKGRVVSGTDREEPEFDTIYRVFDRDTASEYKQWARDNYEVGTLIKDVWHPIIRSECAKMNQENKEI